jgi:hypothetical protein
VRSSCPGGAVPALIRFRANHEGLGGKTHSGFPTMTDSIFATSNMRQTGKAGGPAWRKACVAALLIGAAALLVGCETDGSGPGPMASSPSAETKPEPPMTHSRAAMECWMQTEKGRSDMNLDRRADIVTKCIDDKMKAAKAAPAAPKT